MKEYPKNSSKSRNPRKERLRDYDSERLVKSLNKEDIKKNNRRNSKEPLEGIY